MQAIGPEQTSRLDWASPGSRRQSSSAARQMNTEQIKAVLANEEPEPVFDEFILAKQAEAETARNNSGRVVGTASKLMPRSLKPVAATRI
jgi:hypothetical protein